MDPVVLWALIRRRRKRTHRYWIHPLNLQRGVWGEHLKVLEMHKKYPIKFRQYTRMTPDQFDIVLGLVRNDLQQQDTNYRTAIPPELRLFVTLRYVKGSAPRNDYVLPIS